MTKRVEFQNLLYWLSRGLLILGAGLIVLLIISILFLPQYMKFTFIATMGCFALATILALINTFLHNNNFIK